MPSTCQPVGICFTHYLCLQLLLCLLLFSVALFLTTVIAKVLASYFHKKTFFDQMAETLKNVRACSLPHVMVSTSYLTDLGSECCIPECR